MPQTILYTDEQENAIVMEFKKKWNISKAETMKRMIREFKEPLKKENKVEEVEKENKVVEKVK